MLELIHAGSLLLPWGAREIPSFLMRHLAAQEVDYDLSTFCSLPDLRHLAAREFD
jgi:hypothetical protein